MTVRNSPLLERKKKCLSPPPTGPITNYSKTSFNLVLLSGNKIFLLNQGDLRKLKL